MSSFQKWHTVFFSKEVIFIEIRKTQGCYLLFFIQSSFLKGFSRNYTSQDVRWKWFPKHLNKQKAFSWNWSERNIAAQLITSWDSGRVWISIGKYHLVTFRAARLGIASLEVKNSWPGFMYVYMYVLVSHYLSKKQEWRHLTCLIPVQQQCGTDDSKQCLFFPLLSIPVSYHKARSPHPAGGFARDNLAGYLAGK